MKKVTLTISLMPWTHSFIERVAKSEGLKVADIVHEYLRKGIEDEMWSPLSLGPV